MMTRTGACALLVVAALMPAPLLAQEAEAGSAGEVTASTSADGAAAADALANMEAAAAAVEAAATKPCELHVWPTENYLGVQMGLLSGFGIVGALADQAAHKDRVTTVKDLMRDYLGPEVQLEELGKLDYMGQLKLDPASYAVVIHEPTPFNEDLKDNPALKAEVKAMNAKIKAGQRLTASTTPCYAELITTHIFYHKAMMYGSNLFTGWQFRRFDGSKLTATGVGQVKNPLEHFPPKDATMIDAAKAELRDAYSRDFTEWVAKKSGV